MADNDSDFGTTLVIYLVLGLVGYGAWHGISVVSDWFKGGSAAKAETPDSRDEQIKQLNARIAQLEAKPVEHHYELHQDGLRTFRFDPATGRSCIQLTTKQDWKRPDTIRQGCEYQDWVNAEGATYKDRLSAECWLVDVKSACDELQKPQ